MIIMKFGGTSNRDAAAMSNVLRIIKNHIHERPVVVISAIASATNELEESARTAAAGNEPGACAVIDRMYDRHLAILKSLVHDERRSAALASAFASYRGELARLVQGVSILRELTPRTMDAFCSYGERFSSRLVAAGLQEQGVDAAWVDASEFMVTDGNFGRAIPVMESVRANLERVVVPIVERSQVPVTQGFIGVTAGGAYTTMGRESSDYSASIIGAALDADRVQIWTDVDGLLTADPRKVSDVKKVRRMSFEEAFELSYFGAKVLHPRTMLPLLEKNIPVEIRNSRREEGTGTVVLRGDAIPAGSPSVKSIAFSPDITVICITPVRRTNQYHFWEGVFGVLAGSGIDVRSVTTSEFRIAFTVTGPFDSDGLVLGLREFGDVLVIPEQASLCMVGSGLREFPELAGRVFHALGGIGTSLIAYGASGYSMTLVVHRAHLARALDSLHAEFFGPSVPSGEFDVPLT